MDQVRNMGGMLGAMPRRGQVAVAAVAIATILVLFLVVRTATATDWATVRGEMKPEQAGTVTKALDEASIPNQVIDNGTVVQVPKSQLSQARVALAEANALGTGGSHTSCAEIYGKVSALGGTTSDMQRVNAQQCLQNSIANDIERIAGVNSASVAVVMPETELFTEEQNKATASITLDTGGQSLEQKQVKAISMLTASAVKGMDPGDVTIVDEQGNLLTSATGGGDTMTEPQMKMRVEAAYNAQLESKLMSRFEAIAGPGKVKVLPNSELDMDAIRREVKQYGGDDGKQGIVRAETRKSEELTGTAKAAGGTAGTGSNIPGGSYASASTGSAASTTDAIEDVKRAQDLDGVPDGTKTRLQNEAINKYKSPDPAYDGNELEVVYDNDELAEAISVAPGKVLRDNVAIFIDKSVPGPVADAIEQAAGDVTGRDTADNVKTYKDLDFAEKAASNAASEARKAMILGYVKWALLGLGLIAMAFFMRRTLNQRTAELLNPAEDVLLLERSMDPIPLKELEAAVNAAGTLENQKRIDLQRKVEQIAMNKPADVAQQLRGWLHEGDPYRAR